MAKQAKLPREKKNKTTFTDIGIRRLNVKKHFDKLNTERRKRGLKPSVQDMIWDEAQKGLALLLSTGGSKTFRSYYMLNGKQRSRTLGSFGSMVPDANLKKENVQIGRAREMAANDRAFAQEGIDPERAKPEQPELLPPQSYGAVVDDFIEKYAKHKQRTWNQTERILKSTCADWLKTPITKITKKDVRDLLEKFIAQGHGPKAAITRTWLKKLWRWAYERDLVEAPIIDGVSIEYTKRHRDRVYTDTEIKDIWNAAEQCGPDEAAFVKLLALLAPRHTSLACLQYSHLDDAKNPTLWTTPFELTKSRKSAKKRTYLTPLPPLAQRILKGLPRRGDDDRVFPTLHVITRRTGQREHNDAILKNRLRKHGAPEDYHAHAWRHTIATWFRDKGYSDWDIGLALNHAGSGVTAGYGKGYPLELKRKLLDEWSDHVEGLLAPKGIRRLR